MHKGNYRTPKRCFVIRSQIPPVLPFQVALKNRLALEEAAKDHPLGTYPVPLRTSQWEQESFAEAKKESYSDALAKQVRRLLRYLGFY
jgi:2-methylcitrate dehydratase PrpD